MSQELYITAADIIDKVNSRQGSLRNLVFGCKIQNKKLMYKICIETLKLRDGFRFLLSEISDLASDAIFVEHSQFLLHVLLYEHLFGHGITNCSTKWKKTIENFNSELDRLKDEAFSKKNNPDDAALSEIIMLPRYARVNTLKISTEEAVEVLKKNGWNFLEADAATRKGYISFIDKLPKYGFCVDLDIADVLVFAQGTDLHEEQLVIEGKLALQDKSSCIPTLCLDVKPGCSVIDMCAAPGIKTSHLAALMKNEGHIFAFDRAFDRFRLMEDTLSKNGVACATTACQDMLKLKLNDKAYKKVEYILLDPPCSGSGMARRLDHLTDGGVMATKDEHRLRKLANLQSTMLKQALGAPGLRRLVYSTCSVHEEENEAVVAEALNSHADRFRLAAAMPSWKQRGAKTYDFGRQCIRASPDVDRTNGFFVAVFERL